MSLKDFVVISKLGQGAYSSVYKVKRLQDEKIYALKKVKMNNLSDKEQQNALNQVRILASVNSPYVIGYKHAFIQTNFLCIIMQYSDDGDLYQKIVFHQKQNTNFDEETVWKTLIQVLIGLKTLHELNILHRDLKSANIFMNKDGTAKLGDMNVSKIAKNGLLYTQTGTPYYASPQVWKDKPYDSKSDIWSLGCVIYEMITLKPPFRAQDMDGLYKKVIKGSYSKIGQQYSRNLSKVIKQMLQVNPSHRPSAIQLLKSLSDKALQLGIDCQFDIKNQHQLLQTIRAQKKLHYLTDRLPKSKYHDNDNQNSALIKGNQISKSKNSIGLNYPNIRNLPKLERIIIKNTSHKSPVSYNQIEVQKYQGLENNLLKIEGKNNNNNNNPTYNYEGVDPAKKIIARDIKAQLKKIYNIKSTPKRALKQNIQLPKIH